MKKMHYYFLIWVIYVSFLTGQLVQTIGEMSTPTLCTWKTPVFWVVLNIFIFGLGYLCAKEKYKF